MAAKAVASAVDSITKATTSAINESLKADERLNAIAEQILAHVSTVAATSKGIERRTSLIWWKESLYSPAANVSYRTLGVGTACAWMAVDAVAITGPFAPRMAEALVAETLRSFRASEADEPMLLSTLCADVRDNPSGTNVGLLAALAVVRREPGRSQLAGMLSQNEKIDIPGTLGLSPDAKVTPVAFAQWIYRDLQIALATAVPGKTRKKTAQ